MPCKPAYAAALPLFVLIFILVIFGVLLGGIAAWLRQARWRWAARRAEKENQELRLELDLLRQIFRRTAGPAVSAFQGTCVAAALARRNRSGSQRLAGQDKTPQPG